MIKVIPTVKESTMKQHKISILASCCGELFPCAQRTLKDYIKFLYNLELEAASSKEAGISFRLDSTLTEEEYKLNIDNAQVIVFAATEAGALNAVSTLVQLLERVGDSFSIQVGSIRDYPDCEWRGMMIDVSRTWHEISRLYRYIDACRFFKVKYLHIHFTDDASYTLPCECFPKLPTADRHYTKEEIIGLIEYAKLRGVELVPELDIPGHSSLFNYTYSDIFGHADSIQTSIISLSEISLQGIEAILKELCELFKDSKYIHIGGDEANIEVWLKSKESIETIRKTGVDVDSMDKETLKQYMWAYFEKRASEMILSMGKTPIVWEGFSSSYNSMISRDVVVMSFENYYQIVPDLLKDGFRILNTSWIPMYIVAPTHYWSEKEIFEWDTYKWTAFHPKSPYKDKVLQVEPTQLIEGGHLLSWTDNLYLYYQDNLNGVKINQELVEARLSCLAENTWNREKSLTWEEFSNRKKVVDGLHMKLQNKMDEDNRGSNLECFYIRNNIKGEQV